LKWLLSVNVGALWRRRQAEDAIPGYGRQAKNGSAPQSWKHGPRLGLAGKMGSGKLSFPTGKKRGASLALGKAIGQREAV